MFEQKFMVCYAKSDEIRKTSSSGGIFYLLAERVLDLNGIIVAAGYDTKFNVKHVFIENKKELFNILGSKYVASDLNRTFSKIKKYLDDKKILLFCGTPCQVAGLKSYLGKDYNNLFLIDFICHGIPSQKVWEKYLCEISKSRVPISVNFRDKTNGWNNYQLKINFSDKTSYSMSRHKDLYLQAFIRNIILRPSCYNCKFKKSNKVSNITLGDMWGANKLLPDMFDDCGLSIVWINSKEGETLFNDIKSKINYKCIDSSFLYKYNPSALKSIKKPLERYIFFKKFNKDENILDVMKYTVNGLPHTRIKRMIKKLIKK